VEGIWRFLTPERQAYFEAFVREYETVRQAEGRGFDDPAYYRALPFEDQTGKFQNDWRIRAKSYQALVERVLRPWANRRDGPLRILDLGSGNGWLAYRLAQQGHCVAGVDLLVNAFDGLGAHVYYDAAFVPLQAEFDRLPLAGDQVDLAVFNGSLHYSTDYAATLGEALRVLRQEAPLVIMDSPVYRDASSGQKMVQERERQFEQAYGFPSNALPSENYLSYERLRELAETLGLEWQFVKPFYIISYCTPYIYNRLRLNYFFNGTTNGICSPFQSVSVLKESSLINIFQFFHFIHLVLSPFPVGVVALSTPI